MKVAIMQPYIFPYIGYFQLIDSVDNFIFYDDVYFIKQGWINRNKVLLNNQEYLFTIPLENQSSNHEINKTKINSTHYRIWKSKFLKSIELSYKSAPYFHSCFDIINKTLDCKTEIISELAIQSILNVTDYLSISVNFKKSSTEYNDSKNNGRTERLVEIIHLNNSKIYINPIGGKTIYNKFDFEKNGIELFFLNSKEIDYIQHSTKRFTPWLSIIDVLMFNSKYEIHNLLKQCELEKAL